MTLRDGDYLKEITDYINNNLNSGYREDELRFMLIKRGYSRSAIERAFKIVQQRRSEQAQLDKAEPEPRRVILVDNEAEAAAKSGQKSGFLSKVLGWFNGQKSTPDSETVKVDEKGNLSKI